MYWPVWRYYIYFGFSVFRVVVVDEEVGIYIGVLFWSKRWVEGYISEWYQANACFLKLHYPRELWRLSPFDVSRCRYVDDEAARRIQDEFRYTYWDFLDDSMNMLNEEDRKVAEEEIRFKNSD